MLSSVRMLSARRKQGQNTPWRACPWARRVRARRRRRRRRRAGAAKKSERWRVEQSVKWQLVRCSSSAGRGSARTHLAAAHEHGGRGRGGGGRVHLHDSCGSAPGREERNEHCAGGAQLCVAVRTGKRATSVDARVCVCVCMCVMNVCVYAWNSRFSRSKRTSERIAAWPCASV